MLLLLNLVLLKKEERTSGGLLVQCNLGLQWVQSLEKVYQIFWNKIRIFLMRCNFVSWNFSVIFGSLIGDNKRQNNNYQNKITSIKTMVKLINEEPLVWIALLSLFIGSFGSATVGVFGLPFYAYIQGFSSTLTGVTITVLYLSSALIRVLAGVWSDKFDRLLVIATRLVIEPIGISLIPFSNSYILTLFAVILVGLGFGLTNPAFALISDLLPFYVRGASIGLANTFLNAGVALGSTTMGILSEKIGIKMRFSICGVIISLFFSMIVILSKVEGKVKF